MKYILLLMFLSEDLISITKERYFKVYFTRMRRKAKETSLPMLQKLGNYVEPRKLRQKLPEGKTETPPASPHRILQRLRNWWCHESLL